MQIKKTAKTVALAIDEALKELNTTIDNIDYEVIKQPSKGIFGLFSRPAQVIVTIKNNKKNTENLSKKDTDSGVFSVKKIPKFVDANDLIKKDINPNLEKDATLFLSKIFEKMGVDVTISKSYLKKNTLFINLVGQNVGVIIGKHGQTLDALQHLVNLAVNKGEYAYTSVILDAENYREKRRKTLEALAFNISKKVIKTNKSVNLEPMNPYERRIIHSKLQLEKNIKTYSEGKEPFRYVVISPK